MHADAADKLLYVVSAREDLSWEAFKETVDAVFAEDATTNDATRTVGALRSELLRGLDALGHAMYRFGGGGSRVFIESPRLTILPVAGLPQAVLTGARSPSTVADVRTVVSARGANLRVARQPAGHRAGPARIVVHADSEEQLSDVAHSLSLGAGQPSFELLRKARGVADYESRLEWLDEPELQWPRSDFSTDELGFRGIQQDGALRLSSYQNPRTQQRVHKLRMGSQAATVDRTWGTWLYLNRTRVDVLVYDPTRNLLSVPATLGLPRRVARALVLASGYLPIAISTDTAADVYCWVSDVLAEEVARLLGQNLREDEIRIPYPTE